MKKAVFFDTSCGSHNLGDYIIRESVERELPFLLENTFIVKYSTHAPIIHSYQDTAKNPVIQYCNNANIKILAGTNILKYNLLKRYPDWNINIFNSRPYKGVILMGVGSGANYKRPTLYTKLLYKTIFNKNYTHSTRDESTKRLLNKIGLKAINTGCPTLWRLDQEHCKKIPNAKSPNVVFTLNDYGQDHKKDQQLINILNKNYRTVYFWPQAANDRNYFATFKNTEKIKIVEPTLDAYRNLLKTTDLDYVGIRLHGGIFAMQHYKRTIILAIDNRTRDMQETYNLNAIERSDISKLESVINSKFNTEIHLNFEDIKQWKEQFKDYIDS